MLNLLFFFFFKQKTAYEMRISDWSSDVCSSDLLIAQSLNQISKAHGDNNAILDNCHVRIAFSSNDERTAKRISDALGTATELRAQRNYAGHRLDRKSVV